MFRTVRVSIIRSLFNVHSAKVQCVPLATEPGWLADSCSMSQQLGALQTHTTDTFLFISHTTNVLLFKFCCNIFIGVRIIKEMPGSVASGTHCVCHTGLQTAFEQDQDGTGFECELSILVPLESCLQTCMTYTIAECTVNKLLMMDRQTVRNM